VKISSYQVDGEIDISDPLENFSGYASGRDASVSEMSIGEGWDLFTSYPNEDAVNVNVYRGLMLLLALLRLISNV
jgi:hypothetical protein